MVDYQRAKHHQSSASRIVKASLWFIPPAITVLVVVIIANAVLVGILAWLFGVQVLSALVP